MSYHYYVYLQDTRSFIFTLQEFAKELTLLVEATYRIYTAEKAVAASGVWSRIGRVFSRFALFLRQNLFFRHLQLGHNKRNAQNKPGLKRRFCKQNIITC